MKRLFWLAMGITIGVLVMRRLSQLAAKMTPNGMATSLSHALSDLADSISGFSHDVRAAMSERETELRAGAGLDGTLGRPETAGNTQAP